MTGGTCPGCGAPLQFGGAHSIAIVCSYCRTAAVRAGAELEKLGKVPDLVATNARLTLGARGAAHGAAFEVVGHLQLGHRNERGEQDAVWDEWYVALADGAWGWIAEAQGRLYFTRLLADPGWLPTFGSLHASRRFNLSGPGRVAVDEVNEAIFVSAEGELPFRLRLGETYCFADCSGDDGVFVTIDYGAGDDPQLFVGKETTYEDLGLASLAPAPEGPDARALACPNCGGSLSLKVPASESATCPGCRALLDVQQHPAKLLVHLQGRPSPALPLGSKGKLGGVELEVIGYLERSVTVEGIKYPWSEYLLQGKGGYRWLAESKGHWVLLTPIPGGKVSDVEPYSSADCDSRTFRHFQSGHASYDQIEGEFYWRMEAGETVKCDDYVAPPYMLSSEQSGKEISWSRGESIDNHELWKAFGLASAPPWQRGVGAAQPNHLRPRVARTWTTALIALAALAILAIVIHSTRSHEPLVALGVPVSQAEPIMLSAPFEITGGPQALEVTARAGVEQAWISADVTLINDDTGETHSVEFQLSHFSGYDSDGSWSEGSTTGSWLIGGVPDGRYLVRTELASGAEPNGRLPPTIAVEVNQGAFTAIPLVIAILLLLAWPALLQLRAAGFENARWQDSDHPP